MNTYSKLVGLLSLSVACLSAPPDTTNESKSHEDDWREFHMLISDATFLDTSSVDDDDMQVFLTNTRPSWGGPSFLASTRIGDESFAEAIVSVGQRYRINPVLLLAHLQMHRSLVSKTKAPSARTLRRAVSCECPESECGEAGIRHQLVCLARGLASDFDAATKLEPTSAGYTFERTFGQVRPANASTLAILSHTNLAGADLLYALMLQFKGDIERVTGKDLGSWFARPARTHFIGSPCDSNSDCRFDGGICAATPRGRVCTQDCSASSICPDRRGTPITFCLGRESSGFIGDDLPAALCVSRCNSDSSCDVEGFTCANAMGRYAQSHVQKNTCLPELPMPIALDEPDPEADQNDPVLIDDQMPVQEPEIIAPAETYWSMTVVKAEVPEFQNPGERWDDWTLLLNWAIYSPDVKVQMTLGCETPEAFCIDERTANKTMGYEPVFEETLFERVSATRLLSAPITVKVRESDLDGDITIMGECQLELEAAHLSGSAATATFECGHGYNEEGYEEPIRVTYRLQRLPEAAAP